MKRMIAIVLLIVMLLVLTGCNCAPKGRETELIVTSGDIVSVIFDYDAQTITAGGDLGTVTVVDSNGNNIVDTPPEEELDIYHYTYDNGEIVISYPNGATCWESPTATGAVSGWDGDYDTDRYIDGDVLALQLKQAYYDAKDRFTLDGRILVGSLFLMIVGAIMAYNPEMMATLRMRWWVKDSEPTEYALRST